MEINQKNFKECEVCEDREATSLCLKCYSYFCDTCFKCAHDNNKKKTNHIKEKIDYFVPVDTRCPEHKGNRINLFCLDEKGKNIYNLIFLNSRTLLCLLLLFKSS